MARLETRLGSLARSLAEFRPERGLCISLFLTLDPSVVPTAKDLRGHARAVVDDARRRAIELAGELGHEEMVAARDDLDAAEAFLEEELDRSGAAGFALYLSGLDGVRHEARLDVPVGDASHVGRAFALSPLVPSLERDRELVVAAVSRERGTIWRTRSGRTELVADRTEEIHRQHDQGGWSQARFQRSIEHDALAHMRGVAELLEDAIEPGSGTLLVVACVEEQRTTFEDFLAPHVREALIGWTTTEAHAGESALVREAERLLDRRLGQERGALLARWHEARGHGSRAAATWHEALEAAADGAIDAVLVDGRSTDAWLCRSCGRGQLERGSCALDGTPLEREAGGALEVVVRGTLAHGGEVRLVDRLDGTDGVAALLRYPVAVPE